MSKYFHISLFLILSVSFCLTAQAQRFGAAFLAGPSLSQIQGDNLAGYDNIAYSAGIKGITYINSRWNVNLELLFSQKGSRDGIFRDDFFPRQGMDLNYIEIPVYVELKDWEVSTQNQGPYSKVSAHAGLSYGRLISFSVIDLPNLELEEVNENDISYILGLRFQWNRHWGVSGRYSRSIVASGLVAEEGGTGLTQNIFPYSLTFRIEYVL